MQPAERINLVFFSLSTALALFRPMLPGRRARAIRLGLFGLAATIAGYLLASRQPLPSPVSSLLRAWLPAPLMLVAYWQMGQFFRAPNLWLQGGLLHIDHSLRDAIQRLAWLRALARWCEPLLELAYLFCYATVPLGLAALYALRLGRCADEYWTVLLPPTYLCYGALPFLQTLPPRSVESGSVPDSPSTGLRALNLGILERASIHVNTFPSAHAAASAAVALELCRRAPAAGLVFLILALGICTGAAVRRYHYAADVLTGMLLAGLAFWFAGIL